MKQTNVTYTYGNGVTETRIRLYADQGKAVTQDGKTLYGSIDVLPDEVNDWLEVDDPVPPEDDTEVTAEEIVAAIKEALS